MNFETIKEKLKHLPQEPGIYLMKDFRGEIIYVGKAKILRNRVRSYFVGVDAKDLKTKGLLREIYDFEVMLTKTEGEAILLERTLIKHHHPRYNILLKDGKEYPYIRVNFKEDWPRLEKVRKRSDDGAFYVGPFSNAGYLATALKVIGRIFPMIRCSRHEFKTTKRPCNYYHMKMCLAPCTLPIDREGYLAMIRGAISFLMGKNRELADDLRQRMMAYSEEEKFELAALIRDQLLALEETTKRQTVVIKNVEEADAIAVCQGDEEAAFCVVMVREGRVIGHETFLVRTPIPDPREVLSAFLLQYYDKRVVPPELLLQIEPEGGTELINALGPVELLKPNRPVKHSVPQRGPRADLMALAQKNAAYFWDESQRASSKTASELDAVQKILRLKNPPHRMECIDISNLQGTAVVASNVCFMNGKPARDYYRHFTIKTLMDGAQDDFGSIREVVTRRLRRGIQEGNLPDLLVIDGGRAQLNAAITAWKNICASRSPEDEIFHLRIVSLAKSRPEKKMGMEQEGALKYSLERVFLPNEEAAVPLRPGSPEFRLLTKIRDEAHRFAIQFHRKKRQTKFMDSPLDSVPGVGPTIKRRLLESFGSIDDIRNASIDELVKVKGISQETATNILAALNGTHSSDPDRETTSTEQEPTAEMSPDDIPR